jgi:hypothetical protein
MSLFQMSTASNHSPFTFLNTATYFPVSATDVPSGKLLVPEYVPTA